MLSDLTNLMRRSMRAVVRRGDYPVILPHVQLLERGLKTFDGTEEDLPAGIISTLRLCDGAHNLAAVVEQTRVSAQELLRQHDAGRIVLWHSPMRNSPRDGPDHPELIVVSPHPDDAVLSIGGWLVELGQRSNGGAMIVDVFSKTAWTRWGERLEEALPLREAEERLAARLLEARLEMLGLPDALLRGHPMDGLFSDEMTDADGDVASAIEPALRRLALEHPGAVWALPLGLGNHIDHRIARDQAMKALQDAGAMQRILFYEDLPYAAEATSTEDFSHWITGHKLQSELIDLGADLGWKLEALRVYWSQFTWSRLQNLGEYAKRLGKGRGAERVWRFI